MFPLKLYNLDFDTSNFVTIVILVAVIFVVIICLCCCCLFNYFIGIPCLLKCLYTCNCNCACLNITEHENKEKEEEFKFRQSSVKDRKISTLSPIQPNIEMRHEEEIDEIVLEVITDGSKKQSNNNSNTKRVRSLSDENVFTHIVDSNDSNNNNKINGNKKKTKSKLTATLTLTTQNISDSNNECISPTIETPVPNEVNDKKFNYFDVDGKNNDETTIKYKNNKNSRIIKQASTKSLSNNIRRLNKQKRINTNESVTSFRILSKKSSNRTVLSDDTINEEEDTINGLPDINSNPEFIGKKTNTFTLTSQYDPNIPGENSLSFDEYSEVTEQTNHGMKLNTYNYNYNSEDDNESVTSTGTTGTKLSKLSNKISSKNLFNNESNTYTRPKGITPKHDNKLVKEDELFQPNLTSIIENNEHDYHS